MFKVVDGLDANLRLQKNKNLTASSKQSLFLNNQTYNQHKKYDAVGDANKMLIAKIIAILIPIITAAVWAYYFLTATGLTLTRFLLVSVLIPLMLVAIYIAFKVWSKG